MRFGPGGRTLYLYDEAGRLRRVVTEDHEGKQRDFESYSYDAAGRKMKLQFSPKLDPNSTFYFGIKKAPWRWRRTMTKRVSPSRRPSTTQIIPFCGESY
jgi:hypothetical protein